MFKLYLNKEDEANVTTLHANKVTASTIFKLEFPGSKSKIKKLKRRFMMRNMPVFSFPRKRNFFSKS